MLGRALFACVWLIIAAGLLLPLLPWERGVSGAATVDAATALAGATDGDCGDCTAPAAGGAACGSICPCHGLLATARAAAGGCVRLRIDLVVAPLPPGRSLAPGPLPPKLPAI